LKWMIMLQPRQYWPVFWMCHQKPIMNDQNILPPHEYSTLTQLSLKRRGRSLSTSRAWSLPLEDLKSDDSTINGWRWRTWQHTLAHGLFHPNNGRSYYQTQQSTPINLVLPRLIVVLLLVYSLWWTTWINLKRDKNSEVHLFYP
jgi:hypothetical protein